MQKNPSSSCVIIMVSSVATWHQDFSLLSNNSCRSEERLVVSCKERSLSHSCPHFLALYSCNPNSFSGLLLLLRIMMFWFLPVTIQSKPPVTTNQAPVTKQQDTLTPSPLRSLETLLCVQELLSYFFVKCSLIFHFKHQILISARLIWVDKFLFCLHDLNKVAFLYKITPKAVCCMV